jgi:hypothetical protein
MAGRAGVVLKRRGLFVGSAVLFTLGAAACSYDFGQFQFVGGDGATSPQGPDGGTGPGADGAVNGADVSAPGPDATVDFDGASGQDGAPVNDAPSGGDASGPDAAACTSPCTTQAKSCSVACAQTLATCNAACPSGNAGKGCRQACQTTASACTQKCVNSCDTCTTQAGCSDPAGCTAATK